MINKIKEHLLEARKNKDKKLISLLTALYSEASKVGKDKGNRETTDDETTQVIKKFIKGLNETLVVTKDETKIESIKFELDVLEKYLPKQLLDDEMRVLVSRCINDGIETIGGIMQSFKKEYNGQFDGKKLNSIIKEYL